jgi:hypothetical protein
LDGFFLNADKQKEWCVFCLSANFRRSSMIGPELEVKDTSDE